MFGLVLLFVGCFMVWRAASMEDLSKRPRPTSSNPYQNDTPPLNTDYNPAPDIFLEGGSASDHFPDHHGPFWLHCLCGWGLLHWTPGTVALVHDALAGPALTPAPIPAGGLGKVDDARIENPDLFLAGNHALLLGEPWRRP